MNKQEILAFIEKKYPTTVKHLTVAFKADMADDFVGIMKILNQLEEEYLIARDEDDNYLPFKKSNYRIGTFKLNPKGFGFVDMVEGSYFVGKDYTKKAMNGDEVLILIDGDEAEVIKVLNHKKRKLVLEVCRYHDKFQLVSLDQTINQKITAINLKDFKLAIGSYLDCKIVEYFPELSVRIVEIIGHKNDPGLDIQAILLSHNIISEFPDEVMQEVNNMDFGISDEELNGRTDHVCLPTVTIDGDDAKDLDDAISIEKLDDGYLLYVHIADVSHYVREGSLLDQEAYKRGTSVYVVNKVVPMLPHSLSNNICSLNPKSLRLTLTCKMKIDINGEVVDYDIYPSYIQTIARLTYNNVNKMLEGNKKVISDFEHLMPMVQDMSKCAGLIRKNRVSKGVIDFNRVESKVIVGDNGKVKEIVLRETKEAEAIIEDFMISANVTVAKQMKYLELPALYRVHDEPREKKIKDFGMLATNLGFGFSSGKHGITPLMLQAALKKSEGTDAFPVLSTALLRSMSKAIYSPTCTGHFGLALEEYLHFTSPIRRYPDLIVHRNLRKYLFNQNYQTEEIRNDESKMEEMAQQTSFLERNAAEAEFEVSDMKKAEYMNRYIGHPVSGVITSVNKFGFYVELPNTVEGLVHISSLRGYYDYEKDNFCLVNKKTSKVYKLGQKVNCVVKYVNKDQRIIEFEVVEESKKKDGKNNRRKPTGKSRVFSKR